MTLTLSQTLQLAVQHHQAGDLSTAEALYRQVLQVQPDNSDALHLLGLITFNLQNYEEAIRLIQQAIHINNTVPNYYNSLGNIFRERHRLTDAVANYQRAVVLDPQFAEAYNNLGLALKQLGQLTQAVGCFQRALTLNPTLATAYRNLGEVLTEQHQLPAAINCLQRALSLAPQDAVIHSLLGDIFLKQKQWDEAAACYQQAVTFDPKLSGVHNNLGTILANQGKFTEAAKCYQHAIESNPNFAEAYNNLGSVFKSQNRPTEAIACYRHAIALNSNNAEVYRNLGQVLQSQKLIEEAVACYRRAIALNANFAEAYNNLGQVFQSQGTFEEAISNYQRAVALNPNLVEAHNNLGVIYTDMNQLTEAIACFQQVLELNPNLADGYANLATAFILKGMIQDGLEHLRHALQIEPTKERFYTGLLWTLNYPAEYDPATIFLEHQNFNEHYAKPLATTQLPHLNSRQKQRRLKLGYVSPDFRQHSVAHFIEPVLAHHNRQEFEIYCYYNHAYIDEVTHRLQQYSDHWRECASQSDEELANAIRQEPIDILIDLAGHTIDNRLLVFARKPAPVQVTYLGYPNTTGLSTMDYRITDGYTDPVGVTDPWSSETLVRMSPTYFCYHPAADSYSTFESTLPALQNGYLTFGSLNSHAKLSPEILTLWANILKAIPNSKLLMKMKSLQDATTRQDLTAHFTSLGIVPERLILSPFTPTQTEHFRMYQQLDIALDSYPFNGATTTCDTLWMGVPVVTLVGDRHASRTGLSILSTVGLTELIAYTPPEYLNICLKLANHLEYVQHLRATLRQRLQTSPLMDAPAFTRQLETRYRDMWEKWCQ